MSYDKTCCGTTCDAKANAEYVAKLEGFVREVANCYEVAERRGGPVCMSILLGGPIMGLVEDNLELIKHAQQNNSTTEQADAIQY